MKKLILILLIIANVSFAQKVFINRTPKTYYVIPSGGSNSNNGLSTGAAWATLTYAVGVTSPVKPGDKIYVKAGNYSGENVVFQKNGLPGSPITIIGYKTTPGDKPALIVNNATPYAAYSTSEMPTYTGTSRVSGGTAFNMKNCQFIIMKNFQVTNYYRAFLMGFNTPVNYDKKCGIELYNCNCMSLGDLSDPYSGFGISAGLAVESITNHVRANGCKFVNCLVVNTGAEGISLYGDNSTLTNCKVYCNETSNVLDYFINICGSYNIILKCHVEGSNSSFGGTHGIGVKSNAEQVYDLGRAIPLISPKFNRFTGCTSRNVGEGFFVRHRWCTYNTFTRDTAYGTHTGTTGTAGEGNCIIIRDGASNNTFNMCYGEGLEAAILFQDTTEDDGAHTGNGNTVMNCVFYNTYFGVHFDDYDTPSDAGLNTIANCTFYLCRYTYGCYRSNTAMVYKNNIYYGNSALGHGGFFKGGSFASNLVVGQFSNCCFYNVPSMTSGFVGTNSNIGTDPLFTSLGALGGATPDLHLQSGSPSKDAGVTLDYIGLDYDGILRPFGSSYSIGAYDR
jgi:hypothetical protein